jgi:hypothetical protein
MRERRLPMGDVARWEKIREIVKMLEEDPELEAMLAELSRRSSALGAEGSPLRFTVNKLWHLCALAAKRW